MSAILSAFKVMHGGNFWLTTIELDSHEDYGLLLGTDTLFISTLGQDVAFYCSGALMLRHSPHE